MAEGLMLVGVIGVALAILVGMEQPAPAASFAVTPFGGSEAVRITHVGRIDVDLEPAGPGSFRHVPCLDAPAGTMCFVTASPRASVPTLPARLSRSRG